MKLKTIVGNQVFAGLTAIACALTFLLASCSQGNDPTDDLSSKGTITGPDLRECACCGGWFITIENAQYRFDELPPGSTIDLTKEAFPLNVRLNWHKRTNACIGDEIVVEKIEKE